MDEDRSDIAAPERMRHLPTWVLAQAHRRAANRLHQAFRERGVRGYHYRILTVLADQGPTSQIAIGQRAGIDRSDMVALLAELEARRMVERAVDPADRRRNLVALTPVGRDELALLDVTVAKAQDAVLAHLDESERALLLDLLRKVARDEP